MPKKRKPTESINFDDTMECICDDNTITDGTREVSGFDLAFFSRKKYRKMEEIEQPPFKAPIEHPTFMRGNMNCECECKSIYLPRNAMLLRMKQKIPEQLQPKKDELINKVYETLEDFWEKGGYYYIAHGTCQLAIRKLEVQKELRPLLPLFSISCIDNIDNSELLTGDILLSRVGTKRSVGKPFLVLGEIKKKKEEEE